MQAFIPGQGHWSVHYELYFAYGFVALLLIRLLDTTHDFVGVPEEINVLLKDREVVEFMIISHRFQDGIGI